MKIQVFLNPHVSHGSFAVKGLLSKKLKELFFLFGDSYGKRYVSRHNKNSKKARLNKPGRGEEGVTADYYRRLQGRKNGYGYISGRNSFNGTLCSSLIFMQTFGGIGRSPAII